MPRNVVFVPIDFDRESISSKLDAAGFNRDKRSLFILEGLLMYLQLISVDITFRAIQVFAGKGSEVVFDHIYDSVLRHKKRYYGEAEIIEMVSKAGEEWHFGIEKGEIARFLATYDLKLIEQMDAKDLEEMYFKGCPGMASLGGVSPTFLCQPVHIELYLVLSFLYIGPSFKRRLDSDHLSSHVFTKDSSL